jgi:hypothetical protein
MTVVPSSRDEVVEAVRALAARVPRSHAELSALETDSVNLARHIQHGTSLHDVPHLVWHFLSDADIRFKDPAYAQLQLTRINEVLDAWMREPPSNKSLERTRAG